VGRWRGFLDSLDSDGGHMLVLVALMGFGIVMYRDIPMAGESVLMGSFAALLMKLKDAGSNREQMDPKDKS
jgi:hypothetical protein